MKDSMLIEIVQFANKGGISLPITLTLDGLIVSGTTISYQSYLQGLSDSFKNVPEQNEVTEELTKFYGKQADNESKESKDPNEDNFYDPNFIHLENASVDNGTKALKIPLWRGKIESITAFNFGKLNEI